MNRRFVLAVVLAAVLAGAAAALIATRRMQPPSALERMTLLDAPRPLPALSLIDHSGRKFARDSLRGHWTLLFFGFTHCPDVCPATLAILAQARHMLLDLLPADQPRIVLVSVDPRRDTPAALGRYVGHFDPEFLGVTGGADALAQLTRELGVVVLTGPTADDGSYTVDHTAAIFVIDPSAALAAVSSSPHEAGAIARDYRTIVARRS